eukprot:gene8689-27503_t
MLKSTMPVKRGYDPESNSTEGFAAAVAVAASVDVVVFVGGNRICEGGQGQCGAHWKSEGHDRPLRLANVALHWMTELEQLPDELKMSVVAKPDRTYRHWMEPHFTISAMACYGQFQYTAAH